MTNKFRKVGILVAFILMIVAIVMMFNKYNVYKDNSDKENELKLKQATAYFQVYLEDALNALNNFSQDENVITYYKEVANESDLETHKNYNYVLDHIKLMESSIESIDTVYVASNHVQSMFAVPDFDTQDYVASESRWFKAPIVLNKTYASFLYYNTQTGAHGMNFSETIKDTSMHGVVSIGVNMEPIFDYLIGLGDIVILKDDDSYDFKTLDNPSNYWNNGISLFNVDYLSKSLSQDYDVDYLPEDTSELNYMGKKHKVALEIEPITGYQIIVLKEAALDSKMIVSSLLQTFFVFFVLAIISVVVGNRYDNKIRNNLYI